MEKNTDTFLKIIDREKDEVLISKWVAFILNPNNTTPKIIEKLLIETEDKSDEADFLKLFRDGENKLMYIKSEEHIANSGIVDIMIQFNKFWIIIENKVDAGETTNQSERYEEYGKKQNVPIKYILLKPNYNQNKLINEKFVTLHYNKFAEILKSIDKQDLQYEENEIYIKELIRHSELYLTIRHTDSISILKSNTNKQKLLEKIKEKFNMYNNDEYETHANIRYNCIQLWKKGWNTKKEISNYKGIHYEILFLKDFDTLCEKNIQVYFDIHNESMNNRVPKDVIPKAQGVYNKKYDFDTDENAEKSIKEIVDILKQISDENDDKIDKKIKEYMN